MRTRRSARATGAADGGAANATWMMAPSPPGLVTNTGTFLGGGEGFTPIISRQILRRYHQQVTLTMKHQMRMQPMALSTHEGAGTTSRAFASALRPDACMFVSSVYMSFLSREGDLARGPVRGLGFFDPPAPPTVRSVFDFVRHISVTDT